LDFSKYALCVLAIITAGCSSVKVTEYSGLEPRLDMEDFFQGELTAHGVVKNRAGRVIRRFNADITATWKNGIGNLDEEFLFSDGTRDTRRWVLKPAGNRHYIGTAGDVVGEGDLEVSGNSVFLDYVLKVPYGDGTIDVRVDDRMYLVEPNVLINESVMRKFGLRVGSILLVILRSDHQASPDSDRPPDENASAEE